MTLKVDERIEFHLKYCTLHYQVCRSMAYDGYFLSISKNTYNDAIFTELGIQDKYEFCRKYTNAKVFEGMFPVIETLEGLSEVVDALFREIKKQNLDSLYNSSVNTSLNIKKCTYKLKFSN